MTARAYFQGVEAFHSGVRFRKNPYRFQRSEGESDLMAWYEGWSTAFDITWRKLTVGQRFQIAMQVAKPAPAAMNPHVRPHRLQGTSRRSSRKARTLRRSPR